MQGTRVKAYAKLNLSLNIAGKEGGYHLLDSFVCNVDLYDTILLKKRKDSLVNVYMKGQGSEGIPPEANNAVRAAEAFVKRFSTTGADVRILKNIPVGGGLGGSSADAAGTLNGMARLYKKEREYAALKEIADSLGSDTGYMLTGGYARLTGRGERVEKIDSDRTLYFLLLRPATSVSTALCYKAYDDAPDGERSDTEDLKNAFLKGDFAEMGRHMYNALERPAARLNPDVTDALREGKSFSPLGCCMTGSGSCVFAFFESYDLCAWALSRYKGKCKASIVKTVVPKGKKGIYSPFSLTEEEIERGKD